MFLLLSALPLCAQTATNELSTLVPAYGEMPPTFWEQHETPIIVASFAFLAVAFLFLRVMLRPEMPVVLPPEVVARQALTGLQNQPEDGKLLSEVSQILRRYIIAAFALPAAELTTAEFCTALAANEKIGAELAQTISGFLRECDERKFAPPPRQAGVQASACSDHLPATPDTLKREFQPMAACALELVDQAELKIKRSKVETSKEL